MTKRIRTFVCIALLAPALAVAAPTTPEDWYKEGDTQYNLGNFDKAVDAFKQGFALETNDSKKPAYLYNIAQAYRQAGDCKNSLFFYKRFLSLKASDTVKPLKPEMKADIDQKVAALETCVAQQTAIQKQQPDGTSTDGGGDKGKPVDKPIDKPIDKGHTKTGSADGSGSGDDDDGGSVTKAAPEGQPQLLAARLVAGVAKVSAGDLSVPARFTGALIAGYPLAINPQLTIELGAALAFQPTDYQDTSTGATVSSSFFSVLANASGVYEVAPKIGLRGDLGVGALVFSGLKMNNPFTENGVAASGAVSMFALRVGVSADYAFTPNVFGTVSPITFSYSPAKAGLNSDISSITRLDFMVGVGYRM